MAICAGAGMTHREIALALAIDRGTLEKHYEVELAQGAYARRMDVVVAMHAAALKGNVSAQKSYLQLEPTSTEDPQPDEKPAKLGKKEQADADARTAASGTNWAGLLPHGSTKSLQ